MLKETESSEEEEEEDPSLSEESEERTESPLFLGQQQTVQQPLLRKRQLQKVLDQLVGNVSEEDSGSWDEGNV